MEGYIYFINIILLILYLFIFIVRFYFPLPECDREGRRIFVLRAGLTDPSKIKMEDVFKVIH
jgi:hypothetical protein